MRIFSYFFLLVIILLGLSFALLNADPVTLNYYIGSRKISLSLLLAFCLGLGVLVGLLLGLFPILRLKYQNHLLRKHSKDASLPSE